MEGNRLFRLGAGRRAAALWPMLLLALLVAATATARPIAAGEALTLQDALAAALVEAWGEPIAMGFCQPMVRLHVRSKSGASLRITVPRGTRLNAPDASFADLVTSGAVECTPSPAAEVELNAFSLAHDRSFPSATGDHRYTVAPTLEEGLLALLDTIGRRSAPDHFGAQVAVWSASSGIALDRLATMLLPQPEPAELEEANTLLTLSTLPAISGTMIILGVLGVAAAAIALASGLTWLDHRKHKVQEGWDVGAELGTTRRSRVAPRPPAPGPAAPPVAEPPTQPSPAEAMPRDDTSRGPAEAAQPGEGGPRLVATSGPLQGMEFPLGERCLISRDAVKWVIIEDGTISAPHAALDLSQTPYRIKDLNSTSGVILGDDAVGRSFADLEPGREFALGQVRLVAEPGKLRVTGGELAGLVLPVPDALVLISREELCVIITGPGDPRISGAHALLYFEGQTLVVRDLNSSNGTFINGQRVEGEASLQPGDRLGLGGSELTFYEGASYS